MTRSTVVLAFAVVGLCRAEEPTPQVTSKEAAEGWIALFDGASTFGWKTSGKVGVAGGLLRLEGDETTAQSTTDVCGGVFRFAPAADVASSGKFLFSGSAKAEYPSVFGPDERKIDKDGRHQEIRFLEGRSGVGFQPKRGGKALGLSVVKFRPMGLRQLFNGKDLSGWKEVQGLKSVFTVTPEGWLNVRDGQGDLQTVEQFDDFVLQLEVLSNGDHLNSGIFYRALPGQKWSGYEAQIRNEWKGNDRSQPVDFGTGAIYRRQAARRVVSSDREWFTMTIIASGNHHGVWVNGYQTADFTDARPVADNGRNGNKTTKGVISIQGHDKTTDLSFRKIRIAILPRPMPSTPATGK